MTHPSASFSATLRIRLSDRPGSFAAVAGAIADAGGSLGPIDIVSVDADSKVRDITVLAEDAAHIELIGQAVRALDGIEVEQIVDRTFLVHEGGKLEVVPKHPL